MLQLYFGVVVAMWSYNSIVHAWEPVIEPWNLIINGDLNTGQIVSHACLACSVQSVASCRPLRYSTCSLPALCQHMLHGSPAMLRRVRSCPVLHPRQAEPHVLWLQEHYSVAPGLHMKVQTVSEMLRMTLAFAAAASLLRAVVEWRQLHAAGKCLQQQLCWIIVLVCAGTCGSQSACWKLSYNSRLTTLAFDQHQWMQAQPTGTTASWQRLMRCRYTRWWTTAWACPLSCS